MCWPCYRLDALHRKQKLHAVRVLSVSEVIDQTPNEENRALVAGNKRGKDVCN
jgi:hypothetical protein